MGQFFNLQHSKIAFFCKFLKLHDNFQNQVIYEVKWVCETDFDDHFALHSTAAAVRQHMAQRHEKSKVCILRAKHGYRGIGIWGKQIRHQILDTEHRCRAAAAYGTTP